MTAERLVEMIEQRRILPERLVAKLRAKVAETDRPMSASMLAKFLVQKKHLSRQQAADLLTSLTEEAEQTESFQPTADAPTEVRPKSNETTTAPRRDTPSESASARPTNSDDAEPPQDSSIFAGLLPQHRDLGLEEHDGDVQAEDASREPEPEDEEVVRRRMKELRLAKLDHVEDLEQLSASKSSTDLPEQLQHDPLMADTNLAAGKSALRSSPSSIIRSSQSKKDRVRRKVEKRIADRNRSTSGRQRKKKKTKGGSDWDSPLLLIGGGVFILLVLCGVTVAWILRWESGEDLLKVAQSARAEGSYTQAISQFERFLEKFPSHPSASSARVELAMARLRQAAESSNNYEIALQVAQDELREIEDNEEFTDAHTELAALLPRIAQGLANQAERAADQPDEADKYTKLANDALALCLNTKYLPKSYRDEGELDAVEETLASVSRYQESQRQLNDALHAMEAAIAAGDTRGAYAAYAGLVQQNPALADNELLTTRLRETSTAEQAGVKFVVDEQPAATRERPTPWVAALAVANRRGGPAAADQGTFCALIDGAVYAVDVATGQLRWRRYIGFGSSSAPMMFNDDVLVVDSKNQELVQLDAASGQLTWRQEIGEPFAAPLVVGERAFVAAESGRLYVIDVASGDRMGYVEFAQPLRVPPVADRRGERLYLTGDHSSIYCLSLRDLTCLGVYYLGHSSGSIRVPPAHVLDKLALVENNGVATSSLRLFSLDAEGAVAGRVAERRLSGLAATPPLVAGRRLIVVTDRGELDVFDVGAGNNESSVTLVATREATRPTPLTHHVTVTDGSIWVGDTQLTKYSVLPTGNRLPVQSIDDNFVGATFDHPMYVVGKTLLHVRRPAGRAGVVIGAMQAETGRRLWETDVAVAPAANPVVDAASQTLAMADVNGSVYRFDEAAVRSRVQDQPLEARTPPANPTLTVGIELGDGRAAYAAPGDSENVLLYNPADQQSPARWLRLPSVVACTPSRFGTGVLIPLEVGQVFLLDSAGGERLAAPFQPRLQPRTKLHYRPAGEAGEPGRQFVISDGIEKIYFVELADQPEPHLAATHVASIGPYPLTSPIVVFDKVAVAATEGSHLARFALPDLKPAGETDVPGGVVWGPFRVGSRLLLATAEDRLVAIGGDGSVEWNVALDGGELAGPPLSVDDGVIIAYRDGRVERRTLADGGQAAVIEVEHPLAAGPVAFFNRIVLAAHDGTLLVVEQP